MRLRHTVSAATGVSNVSGDVIVSVLLSLMTTTNYLLCAARLYLLHCIWVELGGLLMISVESLGYVDSIVNVFISLSDGLLANHSYKI